MEEELWSLEEAWWLRGPAEARRHMLPNCLMVFPEGVMQGDEIVAGLSSGPRWDSVLISDRRVAESGEVVVLSYHATARRPAEAVRRVRCSSCWVRVGGWRLICHQQTLA